MNIDIIFQALQQVLSFNFIILVFLGSLIGVIVGALPGLTTTMGIAILTGITYNFEGLSAIALLLGLYIGGTYGGSISAILLGIPGTGAAAATTLDGFPLAKQGKVVKAITIAREASFIGTLVGILCLTVFIKILFKFALQFTSPEYFLLAITGVMLSGSVTSESAIKGWLAGIFGLIISLIGVEELYCYPRFTFGSVELYSGLPFIPLMIGFFGIPQYVDNLKSDVDITVQEIKGFSLGFKEVLSRLPLVIRSGLLGTGVGLIPGVGEDVAAWVSYETAKKTSKHSEDFGKGSIDGLIAAETANNACIGGALIPLLALGIPGSPPAAVLLGALMLHNIRPGPMLQFEAPNLIYQIIFFLLVGTFALLVIGLVMARPLSKILEIKPSIVMPIVASLCVIGSYALDIRMLDIWLVFIFGVIGYILSILKFPPAPFVLGVILGPLADSSLRRALTVSSGSLSIFITRPVSLILLFIILLMVLNQFGTISKIKDLKLSIINKRKEGKKSVK